MGQKETTRLIGMQHKGVALACVILTWGLSARNCLGRLEGDAELLKKIGTMISENKDKIRYWQGKALIEADTGGEERIGLVRERSRVEFWFSRDVDAARWSVVNDERISRYADGQSVTQEPGERWDEMKKGQTFYRHMHYATTAAGEPKKGLTIWPRAQADRSSETTSFDPLYYLTLRRVDVGAHLLRLYRQPDDPSFPPRKIWQDGNLVFYQVEDQAEGYLNKYTFDLSQGGNLVEFRALSPQIEGLRMWTYERQGGVWVPKTYTVTYKERGKDAKNFSERSRKVTFVENTVNKPIPASEFTLESLGVQRGTPVSDTILKISYPYGELPDKPPDMVAEVPYRDAPAANRPDSNRPTDSNRSDMIAGRQEGTEPDRVERNIPPGERREENGSKYCPRVWVAYVSTTAFLVAVVGGLVARRRKRRCL